MIISMEAADGPGQGMTLGEVEEFCQQVRAAGGNASNRITGLTRGFKGRQFRLTADTRSGVLVMERPKDKPREN